jgi:hypothetical protein
VLGGTTQLVNLASGYPPGRSEAQQSSAELLAGLIDASPDLRAALDGIGADTEALRWPPEPPPGSGRRAAPSEEWHALMRTAITLTVSSGRRWTGTADVLRAVARCPQSDAARWLVSHGVDLADLDGVADRLPAEPRRGGHPKRRPIGTKTPFSRELGAAIARARAESVSIGQMSSVALLEALLATDSRTREALARQGLASHLRRAPGARVDADAGPVLAAAATIAYKTDATEIGSGQVLLALAQRPATSACSALRELNIGSAELRRAADTLTSR